MLTPRFVVSLLTLLSSTREILGFTFRLPKIGGCPDLIAQQNFFSNIDEFVKDKWFVHSSFDTEVLQGKGRCMTASYKHNPINHDVQVSTEQFNEDNNNWEKLEAVAAAKDASKNEAKFTVKFSIPIWGEVSGGYTILGTDYDTYAVIHGCGSFFSILHYDCSWLMSKKQKMDQEDEVQFYKNTGKVLENYDSLDATKFNKVDQIHCDKP